MKINSSLEKLTKEYNRLLVDRENLITIYTERNLKIEIL